MEKSLKIRHFLYRFGHLMGAARLLFLSKPVCPKATNAFPIQFPALPVPSGSAGKHHCRSMEEKPRRCNPAPKHISSTTKRVRHEFGIPDTQPHIHQGHPDMNIAAGSTYKRTGCCRWHLPTNSHLLSCSLLEHPAAAALPRLGYTRFEPQNNISLAGNQSWICHGAEQKLLTEILVKMESRSDRAERYIRILSPPNLLWRYSGIVTICRSERE